VVVCMSKYATISVPVEVKNRLEKVKGKKEWGAFLLEMVTEAQRLKSKRAFDELARLLTEEDLCAIEKSSSEFREKFALR
jgi:predicted CopG family antitoxin